MEHRGGRCSGGEAAVNSERLHQAARTVLRVLATLSVLLCGALFVWVLSADTLIERAAQAFVKMRIEQEARAVLGIDAKGNTEIATSVLQKRYQSEVAAALQASRVDLSGHIERTVIRLCGCNGRSIAVETKSDNAVAKAELARAEGKLAQLNRFIEHRYTVIVQGLTRDVRIFLGSSTLLFGLVALLAWFKPNASLHLYLPGGVLWISTLASAALYLFGQNWFFTLLHNDFMGFAYLGYALGIFVVLCDIAFWHARMLRMIVSIIGAMLGTTFSLAAC
jgi:hypothetical protein